MQGSTLGPYHVLEKLGSGGMSEDGAGRPTRLWTPASHPVWSPDGRRVAFAARRIERHLWELRTDATTGAVAETVGRQLTWAAPQNYYPAVSADGTRAVWTAHPGVEGFLYTGVLGSTEGTKVTGLWSRGNREVGGTFGPDGSRFYFTSNRSGAFNVWMLAADGSLRRVTAYDGLTMGMPDTALYTKFAVTRDRLVLPLERRAGEIWLLDREER